MTSSILSSERDDLVNEKLLPPQMKICDICKQKEFNSSYLNYLKKINKRKTFCHSRIYNIGSSNIFLGKRSLNDNYHIKYKEDESLGEKTSYINKNTKEPDLWIVCNCLIRVHPDCLLESINMYLKYKCEKCNVIYRIGFIVRERNYISIKYVLIIMIVLILLFSIFIFMMTYYKTIMKLLLKEKSLNINLIKAIKTFGLIFLIIFLVLLFIYMNNIILHIKLKNNIMSYLLPYTYKYDFSFGIKKNVIKNYLSLGDYKSNSVNQNKNTNLILNKYSINQLIPHLNIINCPFYNTLFEDIKNKNWNISEATQKKYLFNYNVSHLEILQRIVNYFKSYFNLSSSKEVYDLKFERTLNANLEIGRQYKIKIYITTMLNDIDYNGDIFSNNNQEDNYYFINTFIYKPKYSILDTNKEKKGVSNNNLKLKKLKTGIAIHSKLNHKLGTTLEKPKKRLSDSCSNSIRNNISKINSLYVMPILNNSNRTIIKNKVNFKNIAKAIKSSKQNLNISQINQHNSIKTIKNENKSSFNDEEFNSNEEEFDKNICNKNRHYDLSFNFNDRDNIYKSENINNKKMLEIQNDTECINCSSLLEETIKDNVN